MTHESSKHAYKVKQCFLGQTTVFSTSSECRFWLGALYRRSKFANVCHDLMDGHSFVVTSYAQTVFFLVVFFFCLYFFKYQIFTLFPIVKMNANYEEICWVGNLKAHFQQVPLFNFFLIFFFTILL